jgi:hypothetical protein
LLSVITTYELVEIALLATGGLILNQKREIALVKFVEPLVPGNLFQRICATVTREINPDHPYVVSTPGPTYARRLSAALLRPLPDLVMIVQLAC